MEGASLYLTKTLPEREGMRVAAFLDSKRRTIGADTAALDDQVAEKAAIRCAEAEHVAATTAAARSAAAAASAIEGACKARQREGLADTVGAWAVQRDRTLRREWDLSDPAQVRNAALPRDVRPLYETGDFGHASGLQTFSAELLDDPRIPAERRERLLRGLAVGEREAAARRSAEAADLSATASALASSRAAAEALASRVSATAAHARRDTRAANEDLAAHRAELAATRRHEAAVAGVAHAAQEEASPWLREDTRTAVSASSPHRVRVDHFKGMSQHEVRGIYAELDSVAREHEAARRAEAELRAAEDAATLQRAAAATAIEDGVAAERAARARQYYEELQAAAEARRELDAARRADERARQFPTASGLLAGFGRSLK